MSPSCKNYLTVNFTRTRDQSKYRTLECKIHSKIKMGAKWSVIFSAGLRLRTVRRAAQMVTQWGETPATKPDDPSVIPVSRMVEDENHRLTKVVL